MTGRQGSIEDCAGLHLPPDSRTLVVCRSNQAIRESRGYDLLRPMRIALATAHSNLRRASVHRPPSIMASWSFR